MSLTYSPEEIMEAARYYGEIERICTGYDLIIENYADRAFYAFDEDTYTEAVSDVIESMISKVAAIFKTIMDFIAKQIDKVDNFVNGKKYERLMSPEMKAKFDEVSAGKQVMGVDVVKLHKLQKESEKFIDKFTMVVNGELQKASTEVSYDNTRLKSYVENSQKSYKTLSDEIKKVAKTKVPLTKADFYKMVKEGISANTDMKAFKKKMSRTQKQLTDTLRKLQKSKVLKESANDVIFTEGEGEGFFAKIKNTFMQAINAIKNFIIEHARICEYICMALTLFFGAKTIDSQKRAHSLEYNSEIKNYNDSMHYVQMSKNLRRDHDVFELQIFDRWLKKHYPEDYKKREDFFDKYSNKTGNLEEDIKFDYDLKHDRMQDLWQEFYGDKRNKKVVSDNYKKTKELIQHEKDSANSKIGERKNQVAAEKKKVGRNGLATSAASVGTVFFKTLADSQDAKKKDQK